MPRTSASALAIANQLVKAKPPAPPRYLNQEAREHWGQIVAARPSDFFSAGNLPLLEQYCRTLVFLRHASDVLESIDAGDAGHYGEQVALVSRLTTIAAMLATKLRLTIQASVRSDAGILKERPSPRSYLLGGNVLFPHRE